MVLCQLSFNSATIAPSAPACKLCMCLTQLRGVQVLSRTIWGYGKLGVEIPQLLPKALAAACMEFAAPQEAGSPTVSASESVSQEQHAWGSLGQGICWQACSGGVAAICTLLGMHVHRLCTL